MTTHALSVPDADLIFPWEPPRPRKRAITMFILASFVLHAFCFYLFQITYPPTVALLPPPGRVAMISPQSQVGQVLLRWVEAEDPTLASTTQRPPAAKGFAFPAVQHMPSYLAAQPTLKKFPKLEGNAQPLSSHPPGPIILPRAQPGAPFGAVPTRLSFSGEIEPAGAAAIPEMKFTASRAEPPEAAEFQIAVDSAGAVRYCFLHRTSGDTALDQQARNYIVRCRLNPAKGNVPGTPDALIWGGVTVMWGTDAAPPPIAKTGSAGR
ncbi:MAG: hypothetical protein ACR2MF_08225 [Chthoniobacterales bacterium]